MQAISETTNGMSGFPITPQPDSSFRRQRLLPIGLTVLCALGIALWFLGITPWVLVFGATFALSVAIAQRSSFPLGISTSLMLLLAIYSVLIYVTPYSGLSLATTGGLGLGVVAAASLFWLLRHPIIIPNPCHSGVGIFIGLAALAAGSLMVPVRTALGNGPRWAMYTDAVTNVALARFLIRDGGLYLASQHMSSPLTSGLIAVSAAVGRSSLGPEQLLRHDVVASASLWLLMFLTVAVLAALVTLEASRGGRLWVRILGAIGLAAFTTIWYIAGFALVFGFYNSTLTLIALLAAWHAWLVAPRHPLVASVSMVCSAIMTLSSWPPLAVIPAGLAIAMLLIHAPWRKLETSFSWAKWVLIAIPVPLYFLIFSARSLLNEGDMDILAAVDGGVPGISQRHFAWVTITTLLIVFLVGAASNRWHQFNGLLIVGGFAMLGLAFLIYQRLSGGFTHWGYYPNKMAWRLLSLLLIIALSNVVAVISRRQNSVTDMALLLLLAVPVFNAILMQAPVPSQWSRFPARFVLSELGGAAQPQAANQLFDIAIPGQPAIAARLTNENSDIFANFWLVQLESVTFDSTTEPIRDFIFNSFANPVTVCEAVEAWGTTVRVVTSDPTFEAEILQACPDADFIIDLRPVPEAEMAPVTNWEYAPTDGILRAQGTTLWRNEQVISALPYDPVNGTVTFQVSTLTMFGNDWQWLGPDLVVHPDDMPLDEFYLAIWPDNDINQNYIQWIFQADFRDRRFLYYVVPVDQIQPLPCRMTVHLFNEKIGTEAIAWRTLPIEGIGCPVEVAPQTGRIRDSLFLGFPILISAALFGGEFILRKSNFAQYSRRTGSPIHNSKLVDEKL